MKNVLLITNIYPTLDKNYNGTPVCHFFTREWMKMGYNVRVVHFESIYPQIYNWVADLFLEKIRAKTGYVVYTGQARIVKEYEIEGVPVLFVPVLKYIPHTMFSKRRTKNACKIVCDYLSKNSFIPDIIVGHFTLPQLKMLHLLKMEFPKVKTCMVLHSNGHNIPDIYPDYKELFESVDIWGFRSNAFKDEFESKFGKKDDSFICYSGIPENFITKKNEHNFSMGVKDFIYVGDLIERKYPSLIVDAVYKSLGQKEFDINYIGSGTLAKEIEEKSENYYIRDKVHLLGRIKRENIRGYLDKSDCLIMISRNEAFGLVYVEAMARGCIVIASKHEGMDGVIIDGENGFLCDSGNVDELSQIISKINRLSQENLLKISNNAIETAKKMTDEKVAEHYIKSLEH